MIKSLDCMNEFSRDTPEVHVEAREELPTLESMRSFRNMTKRSDGTYAPPDEPLSPEAASRAEQQIIDYRREIREGTIEKLDIDPEGRDTAHIDNYLERLGLPTRPCIVTTRERLAENQDMVPIDQGHIDFLLNPTTSGEYLQFEDLTIAIKDDSVTPQELELFTCHEKVHESGQNEVSYDLQGNNIDIKVTRNGFMFYDNGQKNHFLEEGFAELVASDLAEVLNYTTHPNPAEWNFTIGEEVALPGQYHRKTVDFMWSAYAATGIELLVAQRPELIAVMCDARTQPQKLVEFRNIIDEIKPGLFNTLASLPNSSDGCKQGLRYIVDEVYNGESSISARAHKIAGTRELFAQRMEQ